MKDFYKSLDYYRKLLRSGDRVALVTKDDCYWLINGYTASKIPTKEMELNPTLIKPFTGDFDSIIAKAAAGEPLSETHLIKTIGNKLAVPFKGKDFVVWFNKAYLDLFPSYSHLIGTAPLEAATVVDRDNIIGLILPIRISDDISLFA